MARVRTIATRAIAGAAILVIVYFGVLGVLSGRGGVSDRTAVVSCGDRPNCVSSRDDRPSFRVEPLPFDGDGELALERAGRLVEELPRTRIVSSSARYLRAESASAIFRFVDDLELELDADAEVIHVRSSSRVGHSDLGANRRRVDALRALWLSGA